jgi:hypothetical protein
MYLSFICLFKTDVLFYERKRYKLDLSGVSGKMGLSVFYQYLGHFSLFRLDFSLLKDSSFNSLQNCIERFGAETNRRNLWTVDCKIPK